MDLDGTLKSLKSETLSIMEPTVYDEDTKITMGSKIKIKGLENEAARMYNGTEGVVIQLKEDTMPYLST